MSNRGSPSPKEKSNGYVACLHAVTTLTQCTQERTGVGTDEGRFALRRRWPPPKGLIDAADASLKPVGALIFASHLRRSPAAMRILFGRTVTLLRRGLVIAQDSGNRYNETSSRVNVLGRLEARHGDPLTALDYLKFRHPQESTIREMSL